MQETKQRPSQILGIPQWASQILGTKQPDWWTSLQLDRAVIYFGRAIENKLHELDNTTKKPRYELMELLDDNPASGYQAFLKNFGLKVVDGKSQG